MVFPFDADDAPRSPVRGDGADKPISVSALTKRIQFALEDFGPLLVQGELSQAKVAPSGHFYATLKDQESVISLVMWRSQVVRQGPLPREGSQVVVRGTLSVYGPRGQYQLTATRIQPMGQGDLAAKFEALKQKLAAEGLFDEDNKIELPVLPRAVGLATAGGSAALADMLHSIRARFPRMPVVHAHCLVQGADAPGQIVAAIRRLDAHPEVDVIVAGRGGGSLEDLWAFNEETVARAIAACPVPTISGIGHEVDFTIADFVVDLRAPTPSAAAELLVADRKDFRIGVQRAWERCDRTVRRVVEDWRVGVQRLARSPSFREPIRVVRALEQRSDGLVERLGRALSGAFTSKRHTFLATSAGFADRAPGRLIRLLDSRLGGLVGRLELLNPVRTIARGFAVLLDQEGNVLRSVKGVGRGDAIAARLSDGILRARVEGVEQGE